MKTGTVAQPPDPESGAALLTVLFVFSLCAVIAMAMLDRQKIDVESAGSLIEQAQGYELARGAEELARQALADNAALTPGVDFPGQRWATLRQGMGSDNAAVTMRIEDLQGRYNLNTLLGGDDLPKRRFQNLLGLLQIDPGLADAVIARLGSKQHPRLLTDISDLRMSDGLSASDFARLQPFICALPETDSLLNVNTAPAVVLKAYIPDTQNYETFLTKLRQHGYLTQPQLRAVGFSGEGLAAGSDYFVMRAVARSHGHIVTLRSVIERQQDGFGGVTLKVLSRDLSHND